MTTPPKRGRGQIGRLAVWLIAVGGLAPCLFLAALHLGDRFHVDHVAGSWFALVQYLDAGVLYPPMFDGTHYAGTRWMPLNVVMNWAAAKLTGSILLGSKMAGLIESLVAASLVLVLLRRRGLELGWCLLCLAAVYGSWLGLYSVTSVARADQLSLLLQLAALVIVDKHPNQKRVMVAAGLLALGFLTKTTAVWAGLAIFVHLARSERRLLPAFLGVGLLSTAVLLLVFHGLSDGRMVQQMMALSLPSGAGLRLIHGSGNVLSMLVGEGRPILLLAPAAVFAVVTVWLARRDSALLELSCVSSGLVLICFAWDPGVASNHLLDLGLCTAMVVGTLLVRRPRLRPVVAALVALGLAWSSVDSIPRLRSAPEDLRWDPLAEAVPAGAVVFAEEPGWLVARGQLPVNLDSYLLPRILQLNSQARLHLFNSVTEHHFEYVVTLRPLDDVYWYRDGGHLGHALADHLAQHYQLETTVSGYHVYRPVVAVPAAAQP